MNQHQIRIMNDPEPSSEEIFIQKACHIHALGRQWSESAGFAGLEALLSPGDRPALRDLIDKARNRQLISVEGREAVGRLAETCVRRVVGPADPDAPVTRSGALVLNDNAEELRSLVAAVDDVLDLEQALSARRQIGR